MRLLAAFFLTALASAQETQIRQVHDTKTDTHVEVIGLFSKPSADGYYPVRVKIANNQKREHHVSLNFTASAGYYRSELKTKSSFGLAAPAGKTVTADFMVPLNPSSGNYGSSTYLALELFGSLGDGKNTINAEYSADQPAVLLSEKLFTPNASRIDTEATSRFSGRYGTSSFTSKFTPGLLPDNWLAYSGFDTIAMLGSDWTSLPAGARTAIVSWLRLGGNLLIYSTSSATPAALNLPADTSFGSIRILAIPASLELEPAGFIDAVAKNAPLPPRHASANSDYEGSWPLEGALGEKPFRYVLFIIVLLIFGIVVGPINLFVFAKSGRRHLLFVTTPIISLTASLLLIALIIFQDGFGGEGRRLVLMEVQAGGGENAVYLHQEQISRTGVLTRSGFEVDTPSLFIPASMASSRWTRFTRNNMSGNFNLQPGGGKLRASGDWFQSRSVQGHVLSSVIPTRGRIESVAGAPGQLTSTFSFPIEKLYFLDSTSHWHRADKISTGKPFTLTPVDSSIIDPELSEITSRFALRHSRHLEKVRSRPGHFVAITRSAPAIDTHPGIHWQDTTTIVTGPVVSP